MDSGKRKLHKVMQVILKILLLVHNGLHNTMWEKILDEKADCILN